MNKKLKKRHQHLQRTAQKMRSASIVFPIFQPKNAQDVENRTPAPTEQQEQTHTHTHTPEPTMGRQNKTDSSIILRQCFENHKPQSRQWMRMVRMGFPLCRFDVCVYVSVL